MAMPDVDLPPLTAKEEAFLLHYPQCEFNATKAAIKAGYPAKTAKQQGSRVLKKIKPILEARQLKAQDAARAVEALKDRRIALIASLEQSLEMVTSLAFYDARQLYEGNNLKPMDQLTREQSLMVEDFQLEENFVGVGDKAVHVGYTKKVRLASRAPYLNMLLRWHGAFAEKAPPKPAEVPQDISNWTAEDLETYKKLKAKLRPTIINGTTT